MTRIRLANSPLMTGKPLQEQKTIILFFLFWKKWSHLKYESHNYEGPKLEGKLNLVVLEKLIRLLMAVWKGVWEVNGLLEGWIREEKNNRK